MKLRLFTKNESNTCSRIFFSRPIKIQNGDLKWPKTPWTVPWGKLVGEMNSVVNLTHVHRPYKYWASQRHRKESEITWPPLPLRSRGFLLIMRTHDNIWGWVCMLSIHRFNYRSFTDLWFICLNHVDPSVCCDYAMHVLLYIAGPWLRLYIMLWIHENRFPTISMPDFVVAWFDQLDEMRGCLISWNCLAVSALSRISMNVDF